MTIIVFDLDDTLYSYESFLKMGFKNVSKYLSEILNYPENHGMAFPLQSIFDI